MKSVFSVEISEVYCYDWHSLGLYSSSESAVAAGLKFGGDHDEPWKLSGDGTYWSRGNYFMRIEEFEVND